MVELSQGDYRRLCPELLLILIEIMGEIESLTYLPGKLIGCFGLNRIIVEKNFMLMLYNYRICWKTRFQTTLMLVKMILIRATSFTETYRTTRANNDGFYPSLGNGRWYFEKRFENMFDFMLTENLNFPRSKCSLYKGNSTELWTSLGRLFGKRLEITCIL